MKAIASSAFGKNETTVPLDQYRENCHYTWLKYGRETQQQLYACSSTVRSPQTHVATLFLFNGHFGRLDYRKNIIALFEVHSLDRTSRDNRRHGPSRSLDHDFVRNNFLNRAGQAVSNARAHRRIIPLTPAIPTLI